ncbi:MBOAT family protein [bacterium D16-54]|nr:MBOAT family protein [bacterium D16-54]RKJ14899.1 MBOAT family protein [bacterium D16-56]
MNMLSLNFYLCVAGITALYYTFPIKYRPYVLLAGSLGFYCCLAGKGRWIFLASIGISYGFGIGLEWLRNHKKSQNLQRSALAGAIILTALPLIVTKHGNFILGSLLHRPGYPWIVPLGLSFYTMQILSYLADVYKGEIPAEKNLLQYGLFVSFFPQIVQGPIPRYGQLACQLSKGHPFQEKTFVKGCQMILWGFFLKMMIADKVAVAVNTVFGNSVRYPGGYVLTAGFLYSIQLYTDFLSCVSIAQGTAGLFGIQLTDNFRHPYMARSVKDFWRRWHISLSSWLRDYIYIPLGGSRKGTWKKYRNLLITFAVSGLWHGSGYKYLFWGLLHGFYQIMEEWSAPYCEKCCRLFKLPKEDLLRRYIERIVTFFLVMLGWILFRADSLRQGLAMIRSMFLVWNPWIFFNDSLLQLGLGWKDWTVLVLSIFLLARVSTLQNKKGIRDWILSQHIVARWTIYIGAIAVILVYGTYGYGFNAQDFIYGGF